MQIEKIFTRLKNFTINTSFRKKFKKTIFFLFCIILTYISYFLLARYDITNQYNKYHDFPLGKQKNYTINIDTTIENNYCINMRGEFLDGYIKLFGENKINTHEFQEKIYEQQLNFLGIMNNLQKQTYSLDVTAYKNNEGETLLLLTRNYTNLSNNLGGGGSYVENKRNIAYIVTLECFTLPAGNYQFIFKDKSSPTPEFDEVITSIGIHPNNKIK
jgi:hypothetical protein